MLFESGAITRRGTVQDQNTTSDYHNLEKEKGKSVFSSFMNLDWRGHKINLIDTPGTSDYVGEVVGAFESCRYRNNDIKCRTWSRSSNRRTMGLFAKV